MRRRIRTEFGWQSSNSNWVQTNQVLYVYDGNLVIQERDINNLPTTTYTRGKDLSGSLEGAGGIGGLLARTAQSYVDAPLAGHSFYHCDANGNITMLINWQQAIVAKYLYDAFGNVLSASGLLADANLYQFSSKEKHLNSGLVYYLYRYYDPNLQRWPNRDPLGENGFEAIRDFLPVGFRFLDKPVEISRDGPDRYQTENRYVFIKNSPLNFTDPYGLSACSDKCWNDYHNDMQQIAHNAATCLKWAYSLCILRGGGLPCILTASMGCGDKAAVEEVAASARLAGCLSGCPKCP
jgi:RHS repeat-associated protein